MIGKKGNILTENIIFIILNLIFFTVLILFVFSRSGGAALLEEEYAKQIALMIDSAKPVMIFHLNVEELVEKAVEEGFQGEIISVGENIVTIKLRNKGGYSYSFFNDVNVSAYPDISSPSNPIKEYVIIIDRYN